VSGATTRVGFAGIGRMGRAMAGNLLRAGFPLLVWNRTAERCTPLVEQGATAAAEPTALAAVDALVTMVSDAAAARAVLASDTEATPRALTAAARAGGPAVAPGVGSVPEVVADGRTGLLAPADAAALARQVLVLLRDGELRHRLGAAAASRAALHFGAERLVADTERVYTDLAVAHGWWSAVPSTAQGNR
jgi:3-hydroxyisobutyrate dehydrogenase-like beta-hydroxyacid dehydrogenase